MYQRFIDKLIIIQPTNPEGPPLLSKLLINVHCAVPDPANPGKFKRDFRSLYANRNETIEDFIKDFKQTAPQFKSAKLYLEYENKIFMKGTFAQIGIQNNDTVKMISLEDESQANSNEGLIFVFWGVPLLMFAISFLIASLFGTFDFLVRCIYSLLGTILFIPGVTLLILGFSEMHSDSLHIAFDGDMWFGPVLCECCGKEHKNELLDEPINQLSTL